MEDSVRPQYRAFLNALRQISRYAIDLRLTGEDSRVYLRPFKISHDDFFEHLYEERRAEVTLKDLLLTSSGSDLFVLIGPRGCGKTCLGRKITRDLESSTAQRAFIAFIDIRVKGYKRIVNRQSGEAFSGELLERIKSEYTGRLFPYQVKNVEGTQMNPAVKLWAYLLERSDAKPLEVFHAFTDLQDDAAILFQKYSERLESREKLGYYHWLVENYPRDKRVEKLVDEVRRKVDICHLVYAARHLYDYHRQYIWIDNVDILPDKLQVLVRDLIRQVHGLVSDYANTIIAVREENVHRNYVIGEEGAPPHETTVRFFPPNGQAIPCYDVPAVSFGEFRSIVDRRMEYAQSYHNKESTHYSAEIEKDRRRLSDIPPATEHQQTVDRIRKHQGIAEAFGPPIAAKTYDQIRQGSRKLLTAMEGLRSVYLANNSIRYLLQIHSACLEYLFGLEPGRMPATPEDESKPWVPKALDYEVWYVKTLFLSWIRQTREPDHRIGVYNIITMTDEWFESDRESLGCFLDYLIITTTWNYMLQNRIGYSVLQRIPTVRHVMERLALLGYHREEILETMYLLCRQDGRRNSIIEIQGPGASFLEQSDQITDAHLVYVTPRGKCLVGSVGNTFGYAYECLRHFKAESRGEIETLAHPEIKTDKAVEELLPHLCDIAEMHVDALIRIRDSGRLGGRGWLDTYYSYYGVPLVEAYSRDASLGRKVRGVTHRRALHLEALIPAIRAYVPRKHGELLDKLAALGSLYKKTVEEVGDFSEQQFSFREKLGQPERVSVQT